MKRELGALGKDEGRKKGDVVVMGGGVWSVDGGCAWDPGGERGGLE